MANVFLEALIVAVATAVLGFIIATLFMLPSKKFSFKKYDFWPQVILAFFVTGFLIHLLCEVSGVNKWYCKHGNACRS
jgi:hypothetical protein